MQVVIDALNWICGLGPMCMMPIIMFVIGICLRVKIGTLLKCCITTGVGFCGVNLVINTFVAQVGPSVQNMVARFGLHTDIMDVGWPAVPPLPGLTPWPLWSYSSSWASTS